MMTDEELQRMGKLLRIIVRDEVEPIVRKVVKEEVGYLPTKKEFFERMDELSGDLKKNGEAQDMITGRQSKHSDQIEILEKKVKKIERTINLS